MIATATTTRAKALVDHTAGKHSERLDPRCPRCSDLADNIIWCERCGRRNKVRGFMPWQCKACGRVHSWHRPVMQQRGDHA